MKMKNFLKSIFFLIISIFIFSSLQVSAANTLKDKLDNLDGNNTHVQSIVEKGGMNTNTNLPTLISSIIKFILGLFGVISLIFIIRSGLIWMTSKGDSNKIQESRKIISSGIVGLAIIASSYAITDFVINQIMVTSDPVAQTYAYCSSFTTQIECTSHDECTWGLFRSTKISCY